MNTKRLREAEKKFLKRYPGGFAHPEMEKIARKHKPEQMTALAKESFAKKRFSDPEGVVKDMIRIVTRSSMVSVFEKPRFRDFAKSLDTAAVKKMALALEELLHGKEEEGFESLVTILKKRKLAKWPLVTVFPAYYRPKKEVFVKPTTTKNVIRHFELEGLAYNPTPTYAFYKKYRALINRMKKEVDPSLWPSNAAFCGFLMMSTD
jgi:hypothetical protein